MTCRRNSRRVYVAVIGTLACVIALTCSGLFGSRSYAGTASAAPESPALTQSQYAAIAGANLLLAQPRGVQTYLPLLRR
jgi:hypothetical protein